MVFGFKKVGIIDIMLNSPRAGKARPIGIADTHSSTTL